MADIAKYQQSIEKFNSSYAKEAAKEPVNFWGLAGFAVAAAYTQSVIPLLFALVFEFVYMLVVPNLPIYRKHVLERNRKRLKALAKDKREKLIKSFSPREREAVEYLRWQKNKIQENYKKFANAKNLPQNLLLSLIHI